jgi:hypothetical protein
MNENGLSAADIAAVTGNGNRGGFGMDGGWGSMIWLFAIIALMGGWGNGGFGGNNFANAIGYENLATSNEVQRGFDNQNQMANQREILAAVNAGTAQAVATTNQAKYDNINVAKDIQTALIAQIGDVKTNQMQLLANQNDCCCSTKMLINEVGNNIVSQIAQARYENAINTNAINANTTAQTQRIIDMMTGNQIQDLRDQLQASQLREQLQGVVRYPNGWTYTAGNNPFCNNNCGCGCGCNM